MGAALSVPCVAFCSIASSGPHLLQMWKKSCCLLGTEVRSCFYVDVSFLFVSFPLEIKGGTAVPWWACWVSLPAECALSLCGWGISCPGALWAPCIVLQGVRPLHGQGLSFLLRCVIASYSSCFWGSRCLPFPVTFSS